MKTIAVATTTRADYGILKPLIAELHKSNRYQLQLLVGGTHLSNDFGYTYTQILDDGFEAFACFDYLESGDEAKDKVIEMAKFQSTLSEHFSKFRPELLVILGDRYEMLALCSVAALFRIPKLHIHGGEKTEGAMDDAFRHAITKLSEFHATSTIEHQRRVIQLGEEPHRVRNVGAMGLDSIVKLPRLSREELLESLDLPCDFGEYYLLTYHPVTLQDKNIEALRKICQDLIDSHKNVIATLANSDPLGREFNQILEEFSTKNPTQFHVYSSLGSKKYFSAIQWSIAVIGNSSSGIIEVPSIGKPSINLGDRQKGRASASSVIHVAEKDLKKALSLLKNKAFIESCSDVFNPYGAGNSCNNILKWIDEIIEMDLHKHNKSFYDLKDA